MRNNFVSVLLLRPVGRDRVKEKPMTEIFISFKIPPRNYELYKVVFFPIDIYII